MASCKDCIHYKPCSALFKEATGLNPPCDEFNAERCEDFIATEDAAPKIEVELLKAKIEVKRLKAEVETLKDNNEHLAVMLEEAKQEADVLAEEHSDLIVEKDQLFDIAEKQKLEIESLKIANEKMYSAIEATKTELAREIFEEIENHMIDIKMEFVLFKAIGSKTLKKTQK